jgi:hypothetical protein
VANAAAYARKERKPDRLNLNLLPSKSRSL